MNVPICKPSFGPEEEVAVAEVIRSGWVVQGPRVAEFESLFAAYTLMHAVAVTSCTSALHAALMAFRIGPGDEVIVPAFTWVATANAVELCGARAVFVDVHSETFNTDAARVVAAFSTRTHAIIPVSLFGMPAPTAEIRELAKVPIVEDCACALGAYRDDAHAGMQADVAAFSFHPRKAITTGEGGMLVTDDAELADRLLAIRDHGANASDHSRHHGPKPYELPDFCCVGSNYRMTDIQAAIGVAQMRKLPRLLELRRARAKRYDDLLQDLTWLLSPIEPEGVTHGYQSYVCWYAPEVPSLKNVKRLHMQRNELMAKLADVGVSTRPGTHAVHLLDYYASKYKLRPEDFPNAYMADRLTIALPLYPSMTDEEQDYVVSKLAEFGP